MISWVAYLKKSLSVTPPRERRGIGDGPSSLKKNLGLLKPFLGRHWQKGALGGVLVLSASLLSIPQPLIMQYLIDKAILGRDLHLLVMPLILLVGCAGAEKLAGLLQQFYSTRFEQEVILDIQEDLLRHTLRFPKSFFDAQRTGYLLSRLSYDVQGLRWFFSSTMVSLFMNILRFLGGIVFLFYLEWRLALGVIALLPGVFWGVRYFSRKMHALSHNNMEQYAQMQSRFAETFASTSLIKSFSTEARTVKRLAAEMRKLFQLALEQSTLQTVANLVVQSLPGLCRFTVLGLGAYWIIQGQWTLGSLLAFQAYMGYVFGPAEFLASANLQLQGARASLDRIADLYQIVPEENAGKGLKVERLKGEVEFRNVSFSYHSKETILEDISFRGQPGEHIAIVGPSGVGKTTLLCLLLRFYQPRSGEIYFDGLPASFYEVGSLRQRMGYVSQSPLLISGTVMENLRYGNFEADPEKVMQAAKIAQIHEFISTLPKGYDSEIGEKGVNLSEGEKQRLSLARALVKDPDILVLDEPTSALDGITEESIVRCLPGIWSQKTLFIVTHRWATIRGADYVLFLKGKRLAGMGTHESLLESNDEYRALAGGAASPGRSEKPGSSGSGFGLREQRIA